MSDADRDARIEQLLLTGLDHYFAARHEQAINVWTRALFFDRHHPRARAYIERARSAMAERLRQSEEMLQSGITAFHRGQTAEARRLIQAALDAGAPSDEAFVLLDRIDRLGPVPMSPRPNRAVEPQPLPGGAAPGAGRRRASGAGLAVAGALAAILALAGAAIYFGTTSERLPIPVLGGLGRRPAVADMAAQEPGLPLPRRGEMALVRARSLSASGHLYDALAALEAVRPTDPQKTDADQLRAAIQRELLAVRQWSTADQERRIP
ncbi:MAG: hypothetical protein IT176_13025 [Acidobacteria bacterium]|nr:hypothetical protein [Acidobacteriota bacterium]